MNSRGYYVLEPGNKPRSELDLMKWAEWFENSHETRRIALDQIGESLVSTVFLGLDHAWGGGPPILWETMVFGGTLSEEQDRCSGSVEQAQAMHAAMVERVKAAQTRKEQHEP